MISHRELKDKLPHRHPMLLVDLVLSIDPGKEIHAIKNVTGNEPCYARLAGGAPEAAYAYPCSLVIESFCQTAGILYGAGMEGGVAAGKTMLFGSITGFRFHGNAYPGDTLHHRVLVEKLLSDSAMFSGKVLVGETLIAEVERLVVAVRPRADNYNRGVRNS